VTARYPRDEGESSGPPEGWAAAAWGSRPGERLVVLHADDVGACAETVAAFAELAAAGGLTAGSAMVPAPAFAAAAELARRRPQLDLGVHLTLTSESDAVRWRAISPGAAAGGLAAAGGGLPHTRDDLAAAGEPAAVAREAAAQLDHALAAGVDVTHLDSHAFALFHPRFLDGYLALGLARRLPALLGPPRPSAVRVEPVAGTIDEALLARWRRRGLPAVDRIATLPLGSPRRRLARLLAALDATPPGVTHLLLHPAHDGAELRALHPATWPARVADHEALAHPRFLRRLAEGDPRPVGYRALRDAMRRHLG
jgi:hypothetical protein